MKTSETAIKRQIKDYLNAKGIFFWYNLQGVACYKGLPDLMAIKDGKFYAIEVKTKKGRLSHHQIKFLGEIVKHGGVQIVAHSYEDVAMHL